MLKILAWFIPKYNAGQCVVEDINFPKRHHPIHCLPGRSLYTGILPFPSPAPTGGQLAHASLEPAD